METKAKIKVDGKSVVMDTKVLELGDINEDMSKVPSHMAYWGVIWAESEKEKIAVDATYRAWRAELSRKTLVEEPKLAEWKVKNVVDSSPKFLQFKEAIGIAARNVTLAKSTFESYRAKASATQSRGAMLRANLEKTTIETKKVERKKLVEETVGTQKNAMRRLKMSKRE